ncbi:MAG: hypothetical protein EOP46_17120 [Sphingobacteriaceae bacterium]|nr:MAG: hypothetical protein EOP46_17120 [Sphingobacteriaceae bacterium]
MFERIIAATYRGIENRRPGGIPYFQTHMAFAFLVWMHVLQIVLLLRIFYLFDIAFMGLTAFIGWSAVLFIGIIFLLRYLLPLEKLKAIELKPGYVKKVNAYLIVYFIFNIIFLIVLISKQSPPGAMQMR